MFDSPILVSPLRVSEKALRTQGHTRPPGDGRARHVRGRAHRAGAAWATSAPTGGRALLCAREKPRTSTDADRGRRLSGGPSSGDLPPGVQCVLHREIRPGAGLPLRVLTTVAGGPRDEISEIAPVSNSRELCLGRAPAPSSLWTTRVAPLCSLKKEGRRPNTLPSGPARHPHVAGCRLANARGSLCRNCTETC